MSVILFQGLPLTRGPLLHNAQVLVDDKTLCTQKKSSTPALHKKKKTSTHSICPMKNGGEELSPIHFGFFLISGINAFSWIKSMYRARQCAWVSRRRQATLDAALGILHVFERDILGVLWHVRFMLRDVGAVTD